MVAPPDRRLPETRAVAERALAGALGTPARLGAGDALDSSGRAQVYRFPVLAGPPGAPASVIVKRAPAGRPAQPWRLYDEWAGLAFLNAVAGDAGLAPHFYAGDRDAGLVVLEDLGAGESLAQLLLGDDPAAAERGLRELAVLLGTLHARTFGREVEYDRLRDPLGSPTPERERAAAYGWLEPALRALTDAIGLAPTPGVADEVRRLRASLAGPGPFRAYTHGDPCPSNEARVGAGRKLFDFESGGFGLALLDGVYWRILFPTCWCAGRLPEEVASRLEADYRGALARGCPAAADDRAYHRAVIEACSYWALSGCRYYDLPALLARDEDWGLATLRQRTLTRFDVVAGLTAETGHLEALGATFGAAATKLRARWPPEADAMPYYPAFR